MCTVGTIVRSLQLSLEDDECPGKPAKINNVSCIATAIKIAFNCTTLSTIN